MNNNPIRNASAIGVGTSNQAVALEITSTNEGLLIPRVPLASTTELSPINAATATASELVYNTNTAGDVNPGLYYLNPAASGWIRLATGNGAASGWGLTGNAGTNPGSDFF